MGETMRKEKKGKRKKGKEAKRVLSELWV